MLNKLVEKAKKSGSAWKWILGIVIAIVLVFVAWMLKRQADKIAALEAEKKLADEKAKDMELRAKQEKDAAMAKALREEAEKLRAQAAERETALIALKKQNEEAKKAVDNAKDWQELEKQARGK
jgi:hypothetical protein